MNVSVLKAHLGEELFNQVSEKLKGVEGLQIIPTNDGSWIPRSRLDEELNKQKSTITDLNQQLAAEKQKSANAETLQNTVSTLTQQVKDRDSTIAGMKRSAKVQDALRKAKVRDAGLVEKLLDGTKISEDDKGNLTGLDDQLKVLKESSAYLFAEDEGSHGGFGGGKPAGDNGGNKNNADVNAAIRAAAGRNTI